MCVCWIKEAIWIRKIASAMTRVEEATLSHCGQSAHHAIWRAVKIQFPMKTPDGGRNVDASRNLLVMK